MSDPIKHECGVAIVRQRKDPKYYLDTYGTVTWGLSKLYLLMEKQRNRGQDGCGVGVTACNRPVGKSYMNRIREAGSGSLDKLWKNIHKELGELTATSDNEDTSQVLLDDSPWVGDIYLGHLRYATHGDNSIHVCHPMVRLSNWKSRRLMVAGNFNLTNTPELLQMLANLGQHPAASTDTVIVMEKIAHFLDEANNAITRRLRKEETPSDKIADTIAERLDLARVLRNASKVWDGGYFMCGVLGHGTTFALRDPNGIRPGYFYADEEVVACASERGALVSAFGCAPADVQEVPPGQALIIDHHGNYELHEIKSPGERKCCTFERIYFSRGNDETIYEERKALGREVVPQIIDAIDGDIEHTVFGFVPNTAEAAYYGMIQALTNYAAGWQQKHIQDAIKNKTLTDEKLRKILEVHIRQDKAAWKDAKLRTFISADSGRNDLVSHAYDITHSAVRPDVDNLVMIDDSIVRGTTLRESLLRILMRLKPKNIIIVSSAPQIRYPDCYGIDMSVLGKFIAFEACMSILRESEEGKTSIEKTYQTCLKHRKAGTDNDHNFVQDLFKSVNNEEICARISELVRPAQDVWKGEIKVIFQSIGGLRRAIPDHRGDWYFTGDYPTPGGFSVVNRSFINYMEGRNERAY